MKKFHLIIICIFYGLQVLGQEGTTTREVMQFTLPKGTEKLNEDRSKGLIHNGFDEKTTLGFRDHVYKKGNLIFYYTNLSEPRILKKRLETKETMMVSLLGQLKGTVVDNSRIIAVNNIKFLIIEYHENDIYYIRFTSDYEKAGGCINGFIEYKKQEDAKAKKYLNDLLQSSHFKDRQS